MNLKNKRAMVEATNGKFFTVSFYKKDGTLRELNGRLKVTKHLRGGESTIVYKENLITIFDREIGQYRNVNLDKLVSFKFQGATTTFSGA